MDIRNLLLVPKNLHIRYHLVLRKLGGDSDGISNMKVNLKINQDNVNKKDIHADKIIRYINEYKQIKRELEIWFALKKCRDWLAEHK